MFIGGKHATKELTHKDVITRKTESQGAAKKLFSYLESCEGEVELQMFSRCEEC